MGGFNKNSENWLAVLWLKAIGGGGTASRKKYGAHKEKCGGIPFPLQNYFFPSTDQTKSQMGFLDAMAELLAGIRPRIIFWR